MQEFVVFFVFFQVHLFVAQVISVAKCTSGTSWGGMKDRETVTKSEWFALIYILKRVCFRIAGILSALSFVFFSLSEEWGLLLSQTITSARPLFKTTRHFPQCNWNFTCPSTSAWLMTETQRKPAMCYLLFLKADYYKLYKTNLVRYVFCLLFLPIFIFFSSLHLSLEDELLTNHIFPFNFAVFF